MGAQSVQLDYLTWNEQYSVGVPLIDDQHKELFDRVNTLIALIRNRPTYYDTTTSREEMLELLAAFRSYADFHFSAEEQEMEKIECKDLDTQKELHADYVRDIDLFIGDIKKGEEIIASEVLAMLIDWLSNHVLEDDQKAFKHA